MSNVLVNDEYLKAIGDAIREKNGTVLKYKPSEMAAQIKNISSGSGSADFSSVFNFKKVTIDPALHAKSVKISLLDGENGSNIINNEEVGLAKSSFKVDATIEDGYLPSNIYTAKIDSANDALNVSGEACTAPPQFPSKYLFANQNFTGYYGTTHIDLTNDKLFASMDVTTSSIKLNFKSDVSISNLTFNNKKKLTAKLSNQDGNLFYTKQAIGKATFDVANKCIIIDLTETGFTNYNVFFDQSLKLLNAYLKDCDFIQTEEMKIIDIEGRRKLFYLSDKELSDGQKTDLLDNFFNAGTTSNVKYLFYIDPVDAEQCGFIYSEFDNKCISIDSEFENPNKYYNCGRKTYYIVIDKFSNYNEQSKTNYYTINDNITFDVLYNTFLSMHNSWFNSNSWYKTSYKEKYDKLEETITALKSKTDSEKQTLIDNAKTNFTQYYNYAYNYYNNGSNGYTDDEVSKIFSNIIYSKGMYTLKNPPKMNIAFEVDV